MTRRIRAAAVGLALVWVAAVQGASRQAANVSTTGDACAPAHLSETGLYAAGQPGSVDARNRAYSPQYPLWSDGAVKTRWVYLPPGSTIDDADSGEWVFPVGTRFWKEFTFNGRKVETRFLWRASGNRWVFASYVWNEAGTDAVLAPEGGVPGVVEVAPGRRHDIPGADECRACHGAGRPVPLGFNALQLSTDRDPNAIHGEALRPGMMTLATLADERRLSPARPELVATPPRIKTSNPTTRAVLGYFAANCGVCHNRSGEIGPNGPSLEHSDLLDGDEVARQLTRQATRWQVPGKPEGTSVMIDTASPDASAMLVRMRSRRPSSQMPPLGTVVRDDAAIDVISKWIAADLAKR